MPPKEKEEVFTVKTYEEFIQAIKEGKVEPPAELVIIRNLLCLVFLILIVWGIYSTLADYPIEDILTPIVATVISLFVAWIVS